MFDFKLLVIIYLQKGDLFLVNTDFLSIAQKDHSPCDESRKFISTRCNVQQILLQTFPWSNSPTVIKISPPNNTMYQVIWLIF